MFARAAFRYETIGFSFRAPGRLTTNRDGIAVTQDVTGAHDSYLGGFATLGYLY